MLNIVYTHASVVLVIFHYYMRQNEQSNTYIIQYDVGGCVICISNKVEYQRSCIIILKIGYTVASAHARKCLCFVYFPVLRIKTKDLAPVL